MIVRQAKNKLLKSRQLLFSRHHKLNQNQISKLQQLKNLPRRRKKLRK